jgi:hypothetical protein
LVGCQACAGIAVAKDAATKLAAIVNFFMQFSPLL